MRRLLRQLVLGPPDPPVLRACDAMDDMRLCSGAVAVVLLDFGTPTLAGPPIPGLYSPAEALSDANSGPLALVGIGGWPGLFGRLACVYRNDRVFVVDEKCSSPQEPEQLVADVLSPTRGLQ